MQILKIIALLIEYPDETLWENRDEALSLIAQDAPMLLPFASQHLSAPLLDKQAEWCEVFERGRATSLLLFEHVHAESRDRGQAMVDLMSQYEKAGLELDCRELPDYLPLYLEYLSIVTDDEALSAMRELLEATHNLAEGAGALGWAALKKTRVQWRGARVACMLSGGNASLNLLRRALATA